MNRNFRTHLCTQFFWYKSRCDHNIGTQSSQETIPMGAPSLVSAVFPLLGLGILALFTPQKAQGVILDRWEFLWNFRLNME